MKREWITEMVGGHGYGGRHHHWGPWSAPGFGHGWGPPFGGPRRQFGASKARRGDVRVAILSVLADRPMNGYQVIQEIAERSGGVWKPSPGSVYPTLQQLEDEGLVRVDAKEGRRLYELTDEGRDYVDSHPDEMSAPWEAMSSPPGSERGDIRPLAGQALAALWQIVVSGSADQQARAREVLDDARRRLYGILADGDEDGEDGGSTR
ncbi:MAG TPA: PadR family transcriptional regulator [Jiangellaceae bacterium]|nr:PadR family transcriptional regulator [Jiangellaceae bacterium]